MPSLDNEFGEGLINRVGINDPHPTRVGEDGYDSLSGDPTFVAVPFGPDPDALTPS